jgi:hypothetical protein
LKRFNWFGINDTGAVGLKQSAIDFMKDHEDEEGEKEWEQNPLLKGNH